MVYISGYIRIILLFQPKQLDFNIQLDYKRLVCEFLQILEILSLYSLGETLMEHVARLMNFKKNLLTFGRDFQMDYFRFLHHLMNRRHRLLHHNAYL